MTTVKEYQDEIKWLKKENKKLRDALAPFACGMRGIRPGDFNRAKRVFTLKTPMRMIGTHETDSRVADAAGLKLMEET